jgi:HEAT repeat protein
MDTPAELIERLASDDVALRKAAATELFDLGAAAVPLMINAVRQLRPSPKYALLTDTLRRLGSVAFGPVRDALVAAQTQEELRTWVGIFTQFGESALPDYINALSDPAVETRRRAITGIGNLKEAGLPAASEVVAMLGDNDEQTRSSAMHALFRMGAGTVPLLQEIRTDGPGRARSSALWCLAELGGEKFLNDRDRCAVERLIRVKLIDDHPMPISCCFLSWIAVETSDQSRVMDFFDLTPSWPATFSLGIAAADSDGHGHDDEFGHLARVFVTPPLDGWTLLVGPWCDPADNERLEDVLELCVCASAEFGKAQAYWFGAQGDGSAWLIAESGTLIRRASNIDEALDEAVALGVPLPSEAEVLAAEEDEDFRRSALFDFAPSLAGQLSIDPFALSTATAWNGHGWLALTPIGVLHGPPPGALKF